ncbi:Uncharacterised protein [Escherichia coli]|nr:Uncharacterised protein [Escherichia coli]
MMWNRSWGGLGPLDIAGNMLLKMQSIWQDWQDLFTIRAVKRGRFPLTLQKWERISNMVR